MREIIVIEDDHDLGRLLVKILSDSGFSVSLFQKGENFLAKPRRADIFIIDINLGGINGIEICSILKNNRDTKTSRVIIISAHPEIRELASRAGADSCLRKPFRKQELLELILSMQS